MEEVKSNFHKMSRFHKITGTIFIITTFIIIGLSPFYGLAAGPFSGEFYLFHSTPNHPFDITFMAILLSVWLISWVSFFSVKEIKSGTIRFLIKVLLPYIIAITPFFLFLHAFYSFEGNYVASFIFLTLTIFSVAIVLYHFTLTYWFIVPLNKKLFQRRFVIGSLIILGIAVLISKLVL